MLSHCIFGTLGCNVVKVALESIHEPAFGLAHMLFVACFACDTVYQIVAFTANLILEEYSLCVKVLIICVVLFIFGQYLHFFGCACILMCCWACSVCLGFRRVKNLCCD